MDYLKTMTEDELNEYADDVEEEILDINMEIIRLDEQMRYLHRKRGALVKIIDRIDGYVE